MLKIAKNSGFTLVELMVAIAIFVIALIGLSSLQVEVNKTTADSGNSAQVSWIIEDLTNRIRANSNSLANYNTNGVNVDCNAGVRQCADTSIGDADTCTGAEMAQFDLWEVACSNAPNTVNGAEFIRANAASNINNLELSTRLTPNNLVQITVEWDARTSGEDSSGQRVYSSDFENSQISSLRATMVTEYAP